MNLIKFCIERPVTVTVIMGILSLFGLISVSRVAVQLTPEIEPTVISVTTRWDGASPSEVESEIVREQEEKLRGVPGLVKLSSTSRQNEASIRLEFALGTPKESALREVSDKLREVPDYPADVDEPVVAAGDMMSRDYIAWIIVRSEDPSHDVRESLKFFEDRVKPYLERVPGLSQVNILGGREREIQVRVDMESMAVRGVTVQELASALRLENVDVSGGQLPESKRDVRLRVVGKYEDPAQILDTVVRAQGGAAPIRVRDLAEVEVTTEEPVSVVRSKGRTVMAINAQREPGSNVLEVMEGLKARMAELNAPGGMLAQESSRLGLSSPMRLDQVFDQTVYIYDALDLVVGNIWQGGLLAVLCLLVFLRSLRSTVLLAATIPVSLLGAFVVMALLGRSVNVISLAGMAFAVGTVVDNAIVVLENIYRRRQLGDPAVQAAYRGTREVWTAISVNTLTTIIVFIPVLTVPEEVGQLFRDISIAICAAVSISLITAVMVIPPAAARMFRTGFDPAAAGAKRRRLRLPSLGLHAAAGRVVNVYGRLLDRSLGSWLARLGIVGGLTLASVLGVIWLTPPASYLPVGNRNLIFGFLIPPPGYNLDKQIELGQRIEATLRPYWEARAGTPEAAALPTVTQIDPVTGRMTTVRPPPIDNFFFVGAGPAMFMGATSQVETVVRPLIPLFQQAASQQQLPGVFAIPFQTPLFRIGGFGAGNSIDLEVSGDDLAEVRRAAGALMGAAFGLVGQGVFDSVRPEPGNFNIPGQEIQVRVDPVRANDVGLTVSDVALAVRALGDGALVGEYTVGGDTIDIRIIERRQAAWSAPELDFASLASAPIATPSGRVVPIGSLAEFRRVDSPQQINRIEGRRSVTLTISTPAGRPLESAMEAVRTDLIAPLRASGAVPPTVSTELAGAADKLTQVRRAMVGGSDGSLLDAVISALTSRVFLALLFCYLIMCALFESFLYPFVIMFSVPLAMVGGVIGLRIVHEVDPTQQLDTVTMLGFIILIGVVVNNATLIVAQALNFMRGFGETEQELIDRMAPRAAIVHSASTRMRPIFMTTLTTVLGTLPLVVNPGAGSELYRGLGAVTVAGLLCSTLFTLLVVPMLMSMFIDARSAVARAMSRPWDPGHVERVRVSRPDDAPRAGAAPTGANGALVPGGRLAPADAGATGPA